MSDLQEKKRAYERAYTARRISDPEFRFRLTLKQVKRRAKEKGLPFDIDAEWAMEMLERQGGKCARSGLPLVFADSVQATSASFDRIDSTRGYTKDNVQIVIGMYNSAKSTLTDEDVLRLAVGVCQMAGYTVTR